MSSPEELREHLEPVDERKITDYLLPTAPRGDAVRATVADSQKLPFNDRISLLTYRLWSERPKELNTRLHRLFGPDLSIVGIDLEDKALEARLDRCGTVLIPDYLKYQADLRPALATPKSKAS